MRALVRIVLVLAVVGLALGVVAGVGAADEVDEEWSVDVDGEVAGVATEGETAVVGAGGGVYGVDTASGTLLWEFDVDDDLVESGIEIDDGTAIFGTRFSNAFVYGVDISDGTEEWRFDAADNINTGVGIEAGTAVVVDNDGTAYGLDTDSGAEEWSFSINDDHATTDIETEDGIAVFGTRNSNGLIYGVDISDGSVAWTFDAADDVILSGVGIEDGVAVMADNGGIVYAVEISDGSEAWSESVGSTQVRSGIDIQDGTAVVGTNNFDVHGFDVATGAEEWVFDADGLQSSGIEISNGVAIVGGSYRDGLVERIDIQSGERDAGSFDAIDYVESDIGEADGIAVFGDAAGNIYGLNLLSMEAGGATDGSVPSPATLSATATPPASIAAVEFRDAADDSVIETVQNPTEEISVEWAFDDSERPQRWYAVGLDSAGTVVDETDEQVFNSLHNPEPADGAEVFEEPVTLEIDVAGVEAAFGGAATVEFYDADNSLIDADTVDESDQTAEGTFDDPRAGENGWFAEVEGQNGQTDTLEGQPLTFTTPYELEIRDETNPENLLDSDEIELRVRFFGDDEQVFERTATDGTVDLGGLPADEELVVTVRDENADYVWRRILIDSIFEQNKIYLLPATEPSSEIRFQLRDDTSRFPPDEARLFIEKPLTVDGETTYQTIAGDEFSAGGEFPTTLVEEERYRLRVSNDAGEERLLGAYTVTGPDNPTVPIGTVQIAGDVETEPVAQASLRAAHPDADHEYEARVIYIDEEDATDAITVGVESEAGETVRPETEESGPYGRYIETYPINDHNFDPDEDSLVVHVEADRGDEGTETWDIPVGDLPDVLADADIDPWILELMGWVSLIALAGLIVIVSPSLAAIVTVGYAALLTAIGILPIPGVAIGVAGSTAILYRLGGGGLR